MKIVLLNVEQAQSIYRSQMVRDFPESELKPFASVQGMMTRGLYEPLAFYDEAGALMAYAWQAVLPQCRNVLLDYFADHGIDTLDYLIITHFDKDHVGGADKILESVSVARVILPQYEKESKQYAQFMEALEQSAQTEREILPAGGEWSAAFGQTRLRVTAAERTDYGADEENDFSLATYVTYGETKFLFPGDAEDARQTELLRAGDIDCDVLKVPYHGRLVDASAAFLAACSPKIAFIPDSDEEAASPMVVAILKELGTDVHSGRDGDLVVVSDGKDVFVKHNN